MIPSSDKSYIVPRAESWLEQDGDYVAKTDPAAWSNFFDTGQLDEGWYDWTLFAAATANLAYCYLAHRNAADAASMYIWPFAFTANQSTTLYLRNWHVKTNERFRIYNGGVAGVGTFYVSLAWIRRAESDL